MCSSTSSTEGSASGRVVAGWVGKPHGLDGSFHVGGARPRMLLEGGAVEVGGVGRKVARRIGGEKRPVVRLEGVESREGAEALRGMEIAVDLQELPELGEGEWWAHELEGCAVVDGAAALGVVAKLVELPSCEALEVRRQDGSLVLVPMVASAVRRVDVEGGRIDVDASFLGELWR